MTKEQECAKYLRDVRSLLSVSAKELGDMIGVCRQTINYWEACKKPLPKTAYLAILYVLGEENYNWALTKLKEVEAILSKDRPANAA